MPGAQAPVFVRHVARSRQGARLILHGTDPQREVRMLIEENRRLQKENARLAEENAALREAADLWIRLYETQLERANAALKQPT